MRRRRDGSFERVNDDGTRSIIWGVASTGQISPQGTAEHVDHASGRQDAIVRPEPASLTAGTGTDFVREDINIDLDQLQHEIYKAVQSGRLKTRSLGPGRAIVEPKDLVDWMYERTYGVEPPRP